MFVARRSDPERSWGAREVLWPSCARGLSITAASIAMRRARCLCVGQLPRPATLGGCTRLAHGTLFEHQVVALTCLLGASALNWSAKSVHLLHNGAPMHAS